MAREVRHWGLNLSVLYAVGAARTPDTDDIVDADRRLDAGRLDDLMARARRQEDELEELRVQAATQVVGTDRAADGS